MVKQAIIKEHPDQREHPGKEVSLPQKLRMGRPQKARSQCITTLRSIARSIFPTCVLCTNQTIIQEGKPNIPAPVSKNVSKLDL